MGTVKGRRWGERLHTREAKRIVWKDIPKEEIKGSFRRKREIRRFGGEEERKALERNRS